MVTPVKTLTSYEDALAQLLAQAKPADISGAVSPTLIPTMMAVGHILAENIQSQLQVPPADNSAMDGYAVRTSECGTPPTRLRISQRIPAGQPAKPLEPGTAGRIFTGAPIPSGADAVVMQEDCQVEGDHVSIQRTPTHGQWIRQAGEDICQHSQILRAGQYLNPAACGLAASVGLAQLPVFPPLKVAAFFTGDELSMPGEPLKPAGIYNSNRFALRGLIHNLGCHYTDLGIVRDNLADTRHTLRTAAQEHDLVITTGGVSVGEEDHIKPAVQAEGELNMWQIAMKPGKPLAYGKIYRGASAPCHFIGLPGNPVSAYVTFLLLVRPFILKCQGASEYQVKPLRLQAAFNWQQPDRRREFLRARRVGAQELEIYPNQGSGVLNSIAWADGLINNPPQTVIRQGDWVDFLPFSQLLGRG